MRGNLSIPKTVRWPRSARSEQRTSSKSATAQGPADVHTTFGKTPAGVAETAKRHGKPVIAVAGHIGTGIDELHEVGIDAVFGIAPGAASLSELLADAAANVTRTTEQIVRTLTVSRLPLAGAGGLRPTGGQR